MDSRPFRSMAMGPPIPEIKFDLENSRSKLKVKGTPVSTASSWLIYLVFHIRESHRLPFVSFHDNRASHSRDTIWPSKFKVKGQGQRYPSQRSVQLTHFLSVSHQGVLSTSIPFIPWQSGLPFPRYNLTSKIQGQRSLSKVKVKGTLVSVASNWLISFCFTSIGPTIPKIWQIEWSTGKNAFEILRKNSLKILQNWIR